MTETTNGTALAVYEAPPPVAASVFGTDDTDEIMVRASRVAHAVQALVQSQGFASNIQGRQHVNVEGWNGLGGLLGLGVRVDFVRPFTDSTGATGYEAAVSIIRGDGHVIGGAQSICTRAERTWRTRDDYAIYSMAQTRATGKAYRSALSWLMKMAGFEATPAEEMPEPAPAAPTRTIDDAARDIGVEPAVLVAWWTRERPDGLADLSDRDIATITRMSPEQLAKAAEAIAAWRTAEQDAADAPAVADEPKRRGRKAEPEAVAAEDVTVEPPAEDDPPVPEDFDDLAAAGSLDGLGTGKGPEEDDIPFGVAL